MLVATDNSTVAACIEKQGETHLAEMCALLRKVMTWCHHYQITLKSEAHSRVPEYDGGPTVQVKPSPVNKMVTISAGIQTDLSKRFTPNVDLFDTHLNHKVPLYLRSQTNMLGT